MLIFNNFVKNCLSTRVLDKYSNSSFSKRSVLQKNFTANDLYLLSHVAFC